MKYSYDEKCLDLARHFFPTQSLAFLEALAQEFQDLVEGRDDIADVKTLPIPDFLHNQDNLRAERAEKETAADECMTKVRQHFDERRTVETSPVQAVCDRAAHLADVPAPFTAESPVSPETLWYCICGQSNFVTVFRCEKCDRRRRPNLNR